MPYRKKGKCVYKTTGKKMGCTKGDVDKYLTALRINAKESTQRKKRTKFDAFYTELTTQYGGQKITDDTTVTAEAEYAPGQDAVGQHGGYDTIGFKSNAPTFTVEKDQKNKVIDAAIEYLEQLKKFGIPTEGKKKEGVFNKLKKIADSLFKVGIEPTDIVASIRDPRRANQYLITGPSAPGGGGKGALLDLKDIKGGLLTDDESNPGGADTSADIEQIDLNTTPAQNDPNSFNDRPEGALEEGKKKSKLEQVIEEMNRREFLRKAMQGAKVAAGASIMPKGLLGKAATSLTTGKTPIDLTAAISKHLESNALMYGGNPFEVYAVKDIKEIVNTANHLKTGYSPVINALRHSGVPFPSHLMVLAKSIFEQLNTIDDMVEYSKNHPDEVPMDLAIEEGERILSDIYDPDGIIYDFNKELMDFGFKTNRITPETQEFLEDNYDIYKCDFVNDPASKARRDKLKADSKKRYEDYEKEEYMRQQRDTAKDINYSRMDKAGGSEDVGYKNTVDENFIDKKGPGRPGDSKRHGIKKKASLASLDKIVHSKTASPRKKQLAHWQANMRRGKAKKK